MKTIKPGTPVAAVTISCLLLISLLWTGCATEDGSSRPIHGPTFNGTVQSIDLQNHRLTVVPLKPAPPVIFVLEATTKFWKNGVLIRPDAVEPGHSVRIHYHESSDQFIAHHVYVQEPYAPEH